MGRQHHHQRCANILRASAGRIRNQSNVSHCQYYHTYDGEGGNLGGVEGKKETASVILIPDFIQFRAMFATSLIYNHLDFL